MKGILLRVAMTVCVLSTLSLSGCVYFLTGDETAPTSNTSTVASASPVSTPDVSTEPFSLNPVYAFYDSYDAGCNASLSGFEAALSDSDASALFRYSLYLTEHRVLLSDARISIGLLTEDSAGTDYYSGALLGAADGEGVLRYSGSSYIMEFVYNNGSVLSGTLNGNDIRYSIYGEDSTLLRNVRVYESNGEWISYVENGELMSVLSVGDVIRFAVYSPSSGFYDAAGALNAFATKTAPTPSASASPAPSADASASLSPYSVQLNHATDFELLTWEAAEIIEFDGTTVTVVPNSFIN